MNKKQRAFTLIELLAAITIMGIITAIALVSLKDARASARDVQRKGDLEDIRSALEIYRADCGSYASSLSWGSALVGSNASGSCATSKQYMSKVPNDPLSSGGYAYRYVSAAGGYSLYAHLEHGGTGQAGIFCGVVDSANVVCNYYVNNP